MSERPCKGELISCEQLDAGLSQVRGATGYLWAVHPGIEAGERSRSARGAFVKENPCPVTGKRSGACPGYVVDHSVALACGGVDHPSNMEWQTKVDAAAKDKMERKGCEKPRGLRGM